MVNMAQQVDNSAEQNGREIIIADYCRERLQEGRHEECVLLCLKRGIRFYALDVPIKPDDLTVGLDKLRRESGRWWKWYGLLRSTRNPVYHNQLNGRTNFANQVSFGFHGSQLERDELNYSTTHSLMGLQLCKKSRETDQLIVAA